MGSLPEKRDLVNSKVVAVGTSPSRAVWGLDGFTEDVKATADVLEKKLNKYMKIFPECSKMTKPMEFEVGGVPFSMMVDKSQKGTTHVTMKQIFPINSVLKRPEQSTILNIEFDKNGQMVSGSLMMGDSKVSEAYRFTRSDKNLRRIDYEQMYKGHSYNKTSFRPNAGKDSWAPIKDDLNRCGEEVPGLNSQAVAGDPLGYIFFELTGLKKDCLIIW